MPEDVKNRRLEELIRTFLEGASRRFAECIGQVQVVLVESESRRRGGMDGQSPLWQGRTDTNRRVVMPGLPVGLRRQLQGGASPTGGSAGVAPAEVALEAGLLEAENAVLEAVAGVGSATGAASAGTVPG